jgi:hypothetical protein
MSPSPNWHSLSRPALPVVVVGVLLCLGITNMVTKASWRPYDDGAFWASGPSGVTAHALASDGPAAAAGVKVHDVLLAIEDTPVQTAEDVSTLLQQPSGAVGLRYTVWRPGSSAPLDLRLTPARPPVEALYFIVAGVGVFTLLVGGAVRLRRPRDPATLHFLWLAVAFFGTFTFSFTGRLDRLDWVFYWADAIATLALPPLFLHFAMIFPDRPRPASVRGLAHAVVVAA